MGFQGLHKQATRSDRCAADNHYQFIGEPGILMDGW